MNKLFSSIGLPNVRIAWPFFLREKETCGREDARAQPKSRLQQKCEADLHLFTSKDKSIATEPRMNARWNRRPRCRKFRVVQDRMSSG